MWIRAALWIGKVRPGREESFRAGIEGEMVPGIRMLPGVRDARVLWPERAEEGAPALVCQILVEFDGFEDIDRMLKSPERQAFRAKMTDIAAMVEGKLSHFDCAVG